MLPVAPLNDGSDLSMAASANRGSFYPQRNVIPCCNGQIKIAGLNLRRRPSSILRTQVSGNYMANTFQVKSSSWPPYPGRSSVDSHWGITKLSINATISLFYPICKQKPLQKGKSRRSGDLPAADRGFAEGIEDAIDFDEIPAVILEEVGQNEVAAIGFRERIAGTRE